MKKLRQALQNQRGETIVEVLVAFVLLMLFLALFTVSLESGELGRVQIMTLNFGSFTVKNVQLQTKETTTENGAAHTFTRYYKDAKYYPADNKEDTTP